MIRPSSCRTARGNPLTITDGDNKVTIFTYNAQGLLLTSKDALNQTTTFTYDALGRLLTTTDPLNRTTILARNAQGNLLTITEPAIAATTSFLDEPTVSQVTRTTDQKENHRLGPTRCR